MFSGKVTMGSTVYCLLCEFYDVLTLCVYTSGFVCFSDRAVLKGLSSKFDVCIRIFFGFIFVCVGIGFMDSSWERMRRVLKRAFAYNGVWWFWSCNPVTDTLSGTPCEIGSASYKFIHITSPFDQVLTNLWVPYMGLYLHDINSDISLHHLIQY